MGFFQRVSTFVLAVAARRIRDYDSKHPHSRARSEAMRQRAEVTPRDERAGYEQIYLDDGLGCSVIS